MQIWLICLAMLCMLSTGCAVGLHPPATLSDPVDVYLVDSGRTSSIVLPNEAGGLTRYSYGDWNWYAMRKTAFWRAIPALLWPTRGALGRKELGNIDELGEPQNLYTIAVERNRAIDLSRRLDVQFARRAYAMVSSPSVGLDFVPFGHSYWMFHTSNHVTTGWMHDLDVKTCGYPAWSIWKVRQSR